MSLLVRRSSVAVASVIIVVIVVLAICEGLGWPFLVGPLQGKLASVLQRKVELGSQEHPAQIHLLGSVRVQATRIEIGAPQWSSAPYTFQADDVLLKLTYADLWHVYRTGSIRIDGLQARRFDAKLERLADGRASWEFKAHEPAATGSVTDLPIFGRLRVDDGSVTLQDAKTPLDVDAKYTLSDGTAPAAAQASSAPASQAPGQPVIVHGLTLSATGHYKKGLMKIAAQTDGVLLLEGHTEASSRQPLHLTATVGSANLVFSGAVRDPLHMSGLEGHFDLDGPSLDTTGEPLGITLPVTPKFKSAGTLVKDGAIWKVVFDHADIGSSRLTGAFTFDTGTKVPLLAGRLAGSRLALSDLGPSIGHAQPVAGGASAPVTAGRGGKVIPDHSFDLPSLRVMNANVLFNFDVLDLGTSALEPLRPARAHLTLNNGVLTLDDLDMCTAQGELSGMVALDGSRSPATWTTNVRVRGLRLDQWVHQKRGDKDPPYISGSLDGMLKVKGSGRSVAEILASLNGDARFHVSQAKLSHLALKAAGLDVAGAVKVLFGGDESLPVHCNIADLHVDKGVLRPKVFVVSLDNATIWADGQVSLADEQIDVRALSSPKSFSPFTLRTPIDVKGPLSKPAVSIEPGRLAARTGAAVLLGLLNPLAAVIPFFDPGAREDAIKEDSQCAALAKRVGFK